MQYIARQPIFESNEAVHGYELLFRSSEENRYNGSEPDVATKMTMDTAVLVGLDVLSGGHSIFLNCTHDLIVEGYPTLFPPELTVVEVLETAVPDTELISACGRLKQAGYRIALDDFVDDPRCQPLVELADVIKVDFRSTSPAECARLIGQYGNKKTQMLAEKIETYEEFEAAARLGYSLFKVISSANRRCFIPRDWGPSIPGRCGF